MKAVVVAALLAAGAAQAADDSMCDPDYRRGVWSLVPAHVKLQTGGYVGAVGLGLGWSAAEDLLRGSVTYGITPPAKGGAAIHSVALRLDGRAPRVCLGGRYSWTPFYAGVGVLFSLGPDNLFITLPDRYPDGYYPPTGVNYTATLGTSFIARMDPGMPLTHHGVYLEVTALDYYVVTFALQPEADRFADIFSTTVGYEIGF